MARMTMDDKKRRIVKLENDISESKKLKEWFLSNSHLTAKAIKERALETFSGDWRSYAIEHAKKADLPAVLENVISRTLNEASEVIERFQREIEEEENEIAKREEISRTSEHLHSVLDSWLKASENHMTQRELDCLIHLIDDGTIRTEEELVEYGVERV